MRSLVTSMIPTRCWLRGRGENFATQIRNKRKKRSLDSPQTRPYSEDLRLFGERFL